MSKKHLIMGTAGHVDHGKTTLIKALTGFDCDTHKQEKKRGITINLGFTHLDLPSGNSLGIVDMPGHADFINTMVSGASGIDFVLLIIAADEGVMPQTVEHFEIMKLLGIKNGLVVITKADLVDDDLLELAVEEIREFVENSFLENAPIIPISATTKQGIDKLLISLDEIIQEIPQRSAEGVFRMFIDRIFTIEGIGTIVNGSVLSGKISREDLLYLLPVGKEVRIRRIERHGEEVSEIIAGDRAAMNLVGLKKSEFQKGMLLSDRKLAPTNMIDAKLKIFQPGISLNRWNQLIFLLGTNRMMVKIHLLDCEVLASGETGLVQLHLPQEIITQFGDKFIIRSSSDDRTIGGGVVIDAHPLHHRRRREKQIEIVKKIAEGSLNSLISAELEKSILPLYASQIAIHLNISVTDVLKAALENSDEIVSYQDKSDMIFLTKKMDQAIKNQIKDTLYRFHKANPLLAEGKNFNELLGVFGKNKNDIHHPTLHLILDWLVKNKKIRLENKTYVLFSHKVEIDDKFRAQIESVENYVKNSTRLFATTKDIFDDLDIPEKRLSMILTHLRNEQILGIINGNFIHRDVIAKAKKVLFELNEKSAEGIKLSEFRDVMATNRNSALEILEYFDNRKVTVRVGNIRKIRG
jgi:selenocysteine-specific elongation factor